METSSTPAPQKMLGAKQLHPTTPSDTSLCLCLFLSHFFSSFLSSPPFLDTLSPLSLPSFQKPTNKSAASGPRPRKWTLPPQHGLQCPNPPSSEGKGSGKEIRRGKAQKVPLGPSESKLPQQTSSSPLVPSKPLTQILPHKKAMPWPGAKTEFSKTRRVIVGGLPPLHSGPKHNKILGRSLPHPLIPKNLLHFDPELPLLSPRRPRSGSS